MSNSSGQFSSASAATTPALVSVTASPGSGVALAGQTITFTLAFNEAVTVSGGTPILALNDGGVATYDAAATAALGDPTRLVFDYTVAASNSNVSALAVVAGGYNGATILDVAGNTPSWANLATTFSGLSVAASPVVMSVTTSQTGGTLQAGQTITLTVNMNLPVTVSGGTPILTLSDGGIATYDAATTAALGDPTRLVFDYTVGSDRNVSGLAVTGGGYNGATILDAAGNAPDWSNLATTFSGLSVATSPAVTSVTASQTSGTLHIGQTITLTVSFNLPMTVSGGTPILTLNDGGIATYDAAATAALGDPTRLVFDYAVAASDFNVSALAVTGGGLNGATVQDAQGQALEDVANLPTTFSALAVATDPVATSITASPATGVEGVGQTITFTVAMSEAVTVSGGAPILFLNDGGAATYNAAATAALGDPTRLVFTYTVGASDHNVGALAVTGGSFNGATIADAAGNNLADASAMFKIFANLGVTPNTVVTAVTASSNLVQEVGQTITFTLTMSSPVTVSGGTPSFTLNDNGTVVYDAAATAMLGDSTKLVFDYTVGASNFPIGSADLAVTGFNLNGASVLDAGGNAPSFSGLSAVLPPIQVEFLHGAVTGVTASVASGELTTGQTVDITLNFNIPVAFTGAPPQLLLNDGATATYDAAHSTSTALVFDYTVGTNDVTTDLTVSGMSGQDIQGGSVNVSILRDGRGMGASLAGAGVSLGLQVNTSDSGPSGPGTGNFTVPTGSGFGVVELFGPSAANVTFSGSQSFTEQVLTLDDPPAFTGTVAGFSLGNQLELTDINPPNKDTIAYTPNSSNTAGALTVSDSAHTANIALIGSYAASTFFSFGDLNSPGTFVAETQNTGLPNPPSGLAALAQPHHA